MGVTLGFCIWDLIALILLLVVVIGFIVRTMKLSRLEKELQEQLTEKTMNHSNGKRI